MIGLVTEHQRDKSDNMALATHSLKYRLHTIIIHQTQASVPLSPGMGITPPPPKLRHSLSTTPSLTDKQRRTPTRHNQQSQATHPIMYSSKSTTHLYEVIDTRSHTCLDMRHTFPLKSYFYFSRWYLHIAMVHSIGSYSHARGLDLLSVDTKSLQARLRFGISAVFSQPLTSI